MWVSFGQSTEQNTSTAKLNTGENQIKEGQGSLHKSRRWYHVLYSGR